MSYCRPREGLHLDWQPDFLIGLRMEGEQVVLYANAAGLRTLADHLVALASEECPPGHHTNYEDDESLEKGSPALMILKVDSTSN